MSRGLGRVEQRILRYFIEVAEKKTANVCTLCAIAYGGSLYFRTPDWCLDRKQEVAVRRALKRLQFKGYPLHFVQLHRKFRGRPLIVLWTGNNRYWQAQLRKGKLGVSPALSVQPTSLAARSSSPTEALEKAARPRL